MRSILIFLQALVGGGRRGSKGAGGTPTNSRLNWQLAGYASTIILGAGVVAMPLAVPKVGVVPFLVALVAILAIAKWMYGYTAAELIDDDSGVNGMGAATARRAGTAGWVLSLTGMILYIVPATVAYATIGVGVLFMIIKSMTSTGPCIVVAGLGLTALCVGIYSGRKGHTSIAGPALLIGVWLFGAGTVGLTTDVPVTSASAATSLMLLAVFAAGITIHRCGVAARLAVDPIEHQCTGEVDDSIAPHHRSSVTTLIMEGAVLILLIVVAVIAALNGWSPVGDSVWLPTHWPSASGSVSALAIILFAGVGTGWVAMSGYPSMHDEDFRSRVVSRSIGIVAVAQVAVIIGAVILLPAKLLANLDNDQSQVASGFASNWHVNNQAIPGVFVMATTILAAVVVLVAVTNACSGFVENLGSETRTTLEAINPASRAWLARHHASTLIGPRNELVFYMIAAIGAGVTLLAHVSIVTVLGLAGLAGGAVITFIQPVVVAPWAARRRAWTAACIALATVILGTLKVATDPEHHTAIAYLQILFPVTIAVFTLLVCRKLITEARKTVPTVEEDVSSAAPTVPTRFVWNVPEVTD